MAATITQAFITQFEAEVHLAFQRMGSKLKNTVRVINNVVGNTVRFQKVAKGSASTKARHAEVVAMDLTHSYVDATVADYYASEYVDKLDLLKTNIDERNVVAQNAAYALGRKTDLLLTTEWATGTTITTSAGMTKAKAFAEWERMGNADVPDDGQRYWVVAPKAWTELIDIDEFSRADYVGYDQLPLPGGMVAKRWLGYLWFTHSGLVKNSAERDSVAWHSTSTGLGIGSEISTEINYVPEKVAHLVTSSMSMGTQIIDQDGLRVVECDE